jgi:uncharacterized metal-binding protein
MLIQPHVYPFTSPFVNLLVLVSWLCIIGSYLIGCVLLFCECPLLSLKVYIVERALYKKLNRDLFSFRKIYLKDETV